MATSREKLEQVRTRLQEWRAEAESANRPVFRRMTKAERFKRGFQWEKDVLEYRNAQHKHSVVINHVLPILNFIKGEYVRNPRDLTAVAYKGGNNTRARLLTALLKQICDSSHARHQQADAFDSGITTGRGYLGIDTSYLADPFGDLRIRTYGAFSVLPDTMRKHYDPNDWRDGWRYIFTDEWEPKFVVETQYPGKKEDLAHANYSATDVPGWFGRLVSFMFPGDQAWETHDDYRDPNQAEDPEPESRTKWQDHYRVTTCWWRDWRKGAYLQRLDAPDWFVVLYREKDIASARKMIQEAEESGVQVPVKLIERSDDGLPIVVPVLMRTLMVGDIILDHTEDPFDGVWKYPIVPYNAYFEDGYEFGITDNIIGPQEVANWAWSTCLHLVSKLANTGWKIKESLRGAKQWLEQHGGEDGLILDESQFGGKVEKLDPSPYPAAFHNIVQQSTLQMREIVNVRTERPEYDSRNMSGKAIALKQASSDQGSAPVFSNMDMTDEILGETLIEHMVRRRTYSREEIQQLVDEEDLLDPELLEKAREAVLTSAGVSLLPPQPPDPQLLAQAHPLVQRSMITEYQEHLQLHQQALMAAEPVIREMAIEMLFDELEAIRRGKTKFGVKSSLSESASSFREMKFAELVALDERLVARGGPGIPRDILINASDAPHKEAILQQEPKPAVSAA